MMHRVQRYTTTNFSA